MSTIYKPRTSAPSSTDKNWLHTSAGGYNSCILITGNSCLPNCVGYAWGRWRELLGVSPKLSRRNAELWYGYTADGYKRGKTPKLGAVICYQKGKIDNGSDGAGHVAIVEKINSDGSIFISQSAYGGSRFTTKTLAKGYGWSGFVFQGFIYPLVDYVSEKSTDEKSYTLTTRTKIYMNASDAKKGRNCVGTYGKGTYYIFCEAYGMINITKSQGVAGAWINPNDHVLSYYPAYKGTSGSLVDALKSLKIQSDFSFRQHLAKVNGMDGYQGLSYENMALLDLLKKGELKRVE